MTGFNPVRTPMRPMSTEAVFSAPASSRHARARFVTLCIFTLVSAAWGFGLNWRYRAYMNPDGISYLDLADEFRKRGLAGLVNTHWSPLYPALIRFWNAATDRFGFTSFTGVHIVNGFLFTVATLAFAWLLWELGLLLFQENNAARTWLAGLGGCLFLHFMAADITAFAVTPDLLLAASAFASASAAVRAMREPTALLPYVLLGISLTLGYFSKAMMLPAGCCLLLALLLTGWRTRRMRLGLALSAALMMLLSTPWMLLLSSKAGRFTFSDSGRLNYLWFVDGLPHFEGWTGGLLKDGRAIHAPRILLEQPRTLEFSAPVAGTYPLWFDPAYWHEGARTQLRWRSQWHVVTQNIEFYQLIGADLAVPLGCLVAAVVGMWVLRRRMNRQVALLSCWPLLVLAMYLLLLNEYRYAAPFLVLFFLLLTTSCGYRANGRTGIAIGVLAGLLLLWPRLAELKAAPRRVIVINTPERPLTEAWMPVGQRPTPDESAAYVLREWGVAPGMSIATVGPAFQHFYARLLRVRVVAEVDDGAGLWRLSKEGRERVVGKLAETGAKVLVAKDRPRRAAADGWREIPGSRYCFLPLSPEFGASKR